MVDKSRESRMLQTMSEEISAPKTAPPQAERSRTVTVTMFFVGMAGLIGLLLLAMPLSIRNAAEQQQTRVRLRLLGVAVNLWVADHRFRQFPPIVNPAPRTLWQPDLIEVPLTETEMAEIGDPAITTRLEPRDRIGSTAFILRDYLQGSMPTPHRPGRESREEYIARLRQKNLTLDPATGFEFWYNEAWLSSMDPKDLLQGTVASVSYFSGQSDAEGNWPATEHRRYGTYGVEGIGVGKQIPFSEITLRREALDKILAGKTTIVMDRQHQATEEAKIAILEQEMERVLSQDPEADAITEYSLDCKVQFIPKDGT